MKKSVVAIMYDFDKTLCTKDMQDYAFIPALGMTCDAFWREVNEMTDREEMDNILAYMFQMVQKAREKQIPITRETFHEHLYDQDVVSAAQTGNDVYPESI